MSRWRDDADCMLKPGIFSALWSMLGPFDVDRFASAANVPVNPSTGAALRFNSRFMEPGTLGMDALLTSWAGVVNYAFPPPAILDRVVQHIATERAPTLLVCPKWHSQSWWPLLMSLQPQEWLLPAGTAPFDAGKSGCVHPCGRSFENASNLQFSAFWIQFG